MTWLLRLLVRLVRRRRYRDMTARVRALEVGLGLVEPTFSEVYSRPEMIDWGSGRGSTGRARRECRPPRSACSTVTELK